LGPKAGLELLALPKVEPLKKEFKKQEAAKSNQVAVLNIEASPDKIQL
jgi:hypothetical protein